MEPKYSQVERLPLDEALGRIGQGSSTLEQKIAEIFSLLREPVFRYLFGIIGDRSVSEDLTQETFLRLYTSLRQGQTIANLRAWIFRVAHNLAVDQHRKRSDFESFDSPSWDWEDHSHPDPAPDAERQLLAKERHVRVGRALRRLSEQERHCLNLRGEGLRYREIAEVLGISTPTVVTFLVRGIRKITREIHE